MTRQEMEALFPVGSRVFLNVPIDNDEGVVFGEMGTVRGYGEHKLERLAIEWDKPKTIRHECGGLCKRSHGWWVTYTQVTLMFDGADETCALDVSSIV